MTTLGTLTGTNYRLYDGSINSGSVVITTNIAGGDLRDPVGNVIWSGFLEVPIVDGTFSVQLPPTDDATLSATGFVYTITERLKHKPKNQYRTVSTPLPGGSTVNMADLPSGNVIPPSPPEQGVSLTTFMAALAELSDQVDGVLTNIPQVIAADDLARYALVAVRGDSITNKEGASVPGNAFVSKLAAALQAEVTTLTGVSVIPSGTSGQTTGQNRAGLQAFLLANRPRVCVIQKSINDARGDRPETPADSDKYMRQMVAMCRLAGVTPVVVTSGPVDPAGYDNLALIDYATVMEARASNALLRAMGSQLGVAVADIETAFGAADLLTKPYAGLFDLADGLHPNDNGHAGWASVIARAIAGLPQGSVGSNPAPYATLVSDTFTRADTTAGLGNAETGQAWTSTTDWGVIGNKAYAVTPADNERAFVNSGAAVHEAHVTVTNPGGRVTAGVIYAATDANNYYLATMDVLNAAATSGTLTIFKCVGNVYTVLHTINVAGLTADQPVKISGARRGASVHRISVNGVGIKTFNDASVLGGTLCGVRQANATPLRFDNFLVTT